MGKTEVVILSFILANLMDYVTTVIGIGKGFHEMNSIVASLDPILFLLLKVAMIVTLAATLTLLRSVKLQLAKGVYIGLVAGMIISTIFIVGVAVHNFLLLMGFPENEMLVRLISKILI